MQKGQILKGKGRACRTVLRSRERHFLEFWLAILFFCRIGKLLPTSLFFRAHAFEEAFRKDRGCSAEKGTAKKGEGERRQFQAKISKNLAQFAKFW